ncbi:DUF1003 domain-containing protein [Deinococcus yavapaiensis]|uniref:Putative membrane protein n=1 Tax=Deinococcus yavapaiensis KR-236 TaxID=694435 RepID=A0A318SAT7_9DEIO|nr:DUF1003 domain-containing protein [Deinococcus yavapaiensis]PYE53658.1 putative membrane protein [Deinococcus yavapaiensis KR-236]
MASPSSSPPKSFSEVIQHNVAALAEMRAEQEKRRTTQDRVADTITRFTGSMTFVYLHLLIIGGWVIVNLGFLGIKPFDPFPFGLLTMLGSLEAIFLSTFVLISQNRMSQADARRAELDLQINMLTEHELTQLIRLTHEIAARLGVEVRDETPLLEAMENVRPEKIVEVMEDVEQGDALSRQELQTIGEREVGDEADEFLRGVRARPLDIGRDVEGTK